MPQPNGRVYIDQPLTNLSVAFDQQDTQFIADQIFPVVPVDQISGLYWSFPKQDWLRDEAQRRTGGFESAGGGFGVQTDSYACNVWAYHKDIDDITAAQASSALDLDSAAARFVVSRLRLRKERQVISDFFGTGIWGTDYTGVSSAPSTGQFYQWSSTANSHPITDIKAGARQILSITGYLPNTLVLGYDAYLALTTHPDILDRIKYTSADAITADVIARYFDVDKVLISTSIVNTAGEGLTPSYGFNLNKSALLVYSAPNPGLMTPSAGYTFQWTGVSQGLGATIGTKRFRMEELAADRVESQIAFANKIVAPELGVFYANVVA